MNMVLNGGYHQYQSSPTISAKPISSGMLPQPSRPQTSTVQPLQVSIPPPLTIPLSLPQTVLPPTVTNSISAINANVAVGSASQANPNSLIVQQQQQAHFIAQQNLIARQQAAAAQLHAAQQQSADQMAFLQNYGFLSSPAANSNLQTPPTQMSQMSNPYGYSLGPQVPQFYYLPRPNYLPMSLMHPNLGQLSNASFASGLPSGYINSAQLQSVQNANAQMMQNIPASSAISSTSVKRSYESAFRNDPMTVTAAKRAYHPSQSHAAAAANLYGTYPYQQL
jgi:hypothetical protein